MTSSCSLLPALAALLLLSAAAAHGRQLSADDFCQNAAFRDTCMDVLAKSGPLKSELDAEIALMEAAMDKVNEGMAAAKEVTGGDKATVLGVCMANYRDTIEDIKAAMGYLKGRGSDEDVNVSLSSALTNIDSCNTEWGLARKWAVNPLSGVNSVIVRMLSNTIALGNDLKYLDD